MNRNSQNRKRLFRKFLIKFSVRQKHLRGSMAHRIFGDFIFSREFWIPSRVNVAKGVAIGLFFGLQPIVGFQILCAITIALFLKANISAAFLCTWITNPITFPVILWLQKLFGDWVISTTVWKRSHICFNINWPYFSQYGEPLIVGCILSGTIVAICGFFLVTLLWDGISLLAKRGKVNLKTERDHSEK